MLGGIVNDLTKAGRKPERLLSVGAADTGVRTIEWPAFPARSGAELGATAALEQLDGRDPLLGDVGRLARQEEYMEWRPIRRADGKLQGFEMTTELRDYWKLLAAHEPHRTLHLVAEFAGEEEADRFLVYGSDFDPCAANVTAQDRMDAFAETMLPTGSGSAPFSPHNNGLSAICCMVHSDNDLLALLRLGLSAARTLLVTDEVTEQTRYPSGSEAIVKLPASAKDGRNSDPLIVERIVRFVGEGRPIGFDDPLGIYITAVQLHELAQPDGEDVPSSWLELSRGALAGVSPDGRSRAQRLKLELPADADFSLNDLVVRRSGEALCFGGQLAELVELCVYVRTGPVEGSG